MWPDYSSNSRGMSGILHRKLTESFLGTTKYADTLGIYMYIDTDATHT